MSGHFGMPVREYVAQAPISPDAHSAYERLRLLLAGNLPEVRTALAALLGGGFERADGCLDELVALGAVEVDGDTIRLVDDQGVTA